MKKRFLASVLCLSLCTILFAGCSGNPAPANSAASTPGSSSGTEKQENAEAIHLVLGDGSAIGSQRYNQLMIFVEALEEVSGGQLVVDPYWGGTMYGNEECLNGLMNDTCDFAFINPSTSAGVIPDGAVLSIPFCYAYESDTDDTSLLEFNDLIYDTMVDIYDDYGIRWLSVHPPVEGGFFMTSKQISQPSDLKGSILRTSGTYLGRLMENWGASTSNILNTELANALEKGTVDGTFTGSDVSIMLGVYEVAKNVSVIPYVDMVGGFCMSNESWNRLTEEQQGWVMEAIDIYLPQALQLKIDYSKEITQKWEDAGCTIYRMTNEEAAAFRGDYYASVQALIRENNSELGNQLCDLIDDWNS